MKGARGPAWPYWQPTLNPLRCPRCETLGGFARALERSSYVLWPDWIGSRVPDHHWQRHCRAPPPAVVDLTSDCRPAVSAVRPLCRSRAASWPTSLPHRLKMPLKTWASFLCFFLRSTSAANSLFGAYRPARTPAAFARAANMSRACSTVAGSGCSCARAIAEAVTSQIPGLMTRRSLRGLSLYQRIAAMAL